MLNFDFLDKGLAIVSPEHFAYDFSTKIFLMFDQILLPGCVNFWRYWALFVLQSFVYQVVMSWILKLILSF